MTPTLYADSGDVTLWHGDALHVSDFVAPGSVDLIVTSPPYFRQRSYRDGDVHVDGQVGDERTPDAYVDALLDAVRDWTPVLSKTGSAFVNLGDKRAAKALLLLPLRFAVRVADETDLTVRQVIIWSKTNPQPESATDRTRDDFEYWFHLIRGDRYFAALDVLREPYADVRDLAGTSNGNTGRDGRGTGVMLGRDTDPHGGLPTFTYHQLGKLPGSVWPIASEPLTVPNGVDGEHFAAYPTEWPRRLILGFTPNGYCDVCDEPRRPVVDVERTPYTGDPRGLRKRTVVDGGLRRWRDAARTVVGETCGCDTPDASASPAVVLDPFGGTGTTALVARALGRQAIHVDLSLDYLKLARWRVNDPDALWKVRDRSGVVEPRPRRTNREQLTLFGGAS